MKRLLLLALASLAILPALAQQLPPRLEPLAEPPPPPPGLELDPALEPQVTIIQKEAETVEEYRINGQLYMIKVIPKGGPPFYLVDYEGNGAFVRRDYLDSGVRPPMWLIFSW